MVNDSLLRKSDPFGGTPPYLPLRRDGFYGWPLTNIGFLVVTCYGLVQVISECLKFFNFMCSQDLLKTGRGSFSAAVLGSLWIQFLAWQKIFYCRPLVVNFCFHFWLKMFMNSKWFLLMPHPKNVAQKFFWSMNNLNRRVNKIILQ